MRVGVLVVGSLLWDARPHRHAWRAQCLDVADAIRVAAPIRYGRESESRARTYTMVFSRLAGRRDYRGGAGIVIPCRRTVRTPDDLIEEAKELWIAESRDGHPNRPVSASWGAVGAIFRRGGNEELRRGWMTYVRGVDYPRLSHARSESCALSSDGMLSIPWPRSLDGTELGNLDVVLATPAQPTLRNARYARPTTIAEAWLNSASGEEHYFFGNVEAGVRTFQDRQIWQVLARSAKAALFRERYPHALGILEGGALPGA